MEGLMIRMLELVHCAEAGFWGGGGIKEGKKKE